MTSPKLDFVERTTCPICLSTDIEEIYAEPMVTGKTGAFLGRYYNDKLLEQLDPSMKYSLCYCRNCTSCFQKQILDEAGLDYFYDNNVESDASLAKRTNAKPKYYDVLFEDARTARRIMGVSKPKNFRALDFGCGWGHWTVAARACGYETFGAELSKDRLAHLAKIGTAVVDFSDARFQHFFDFVNTDQVMEHVADPRAIVKLLDRVTRPGGILKVFVPNGTDYAKRARAAEWAPSKDAAHPLEHINTYSRQSLREMMTEFGFSPLSFGEVAKTAYGLERAVKHYLFGRASWYFRKG
jgi:SAM-dependent methyltransferase